LPTLQYWGLGQKALNELSTVIGPLAISLVGIALSFAWLLLTLAGKKWQDYWVELGIKIENAHREDIRGVEIFSGIDKREKKARLKLIRTMVPIIFIITWITLSLATIIAQQLAGA
jgi:hypothetical protein